MTTIVTRASNGAPLTNNQMDQNLINLNNDKVETSVMASYATLASPVFTGDPKAPTPVPGDNDTSIATTAFVQTSMAGKVSKTGDTMSGTLFNTSSIPLAIQRANSSTSAAYIGFYNDGNPAVEGLIGYGSSGKNFSISAGTSNIISLQGSDVQFANTQGTDGNSLTKKSYVDTKVAKSGDTMTGALATPRITLGNGQAPVSNYSVYAKQNGTAIGYFGSDGGAVISGGVGDNFAIRALGTLILAADSNNVVLNTPQSTLANSVTRKDYVDTKVAKSGDTMTGTLYAPLFQASSAGTPVVEFHIPGSAAAGFYLSGSVLYCSTTNGGGGATATRWYADSSGNFVASANVIAYSDIRYKTNLERIPNALDKVSQLNGYTFNRTDLEGTARQTGLIAQEVEKVLPEAVFEMSVPNSEVDKPLGVAYGNLVGLLVEAIKELKAEVEALKNGAST